MKNSPSVTSRLTVHYTWGGGDANEAITKDTCIGFSSPFDPGSCMQLPALFQIALSQLVKTTCCFHSC